MGGANTFLGLVASCDGVFSTAPTWPGLPAYQRLLDEVTLFVTGPTAIEAFLNDYLRAAETTQLPAGRSFRHGNGFTKIALYKCPAGRFSVRFHIWWGGTRSSDASVHDHRWSFVSWLVSGALFVTNYHAFDGRGDDNDKHTCYRYTDADLDGVKGVEEVGPCTLRPTAAYVLRAGSAHFLHYTEPHHVAGYDGPVAASLCITGPAERHFSHVYIKQPTVAAGTLARPALTGPEIAQEIDMFLSVESGGVSTRGVTR